MSAYDRHHIAMTTARLLLEVGAVNFRPDPPFTFTSGLASPVYIDCRKLISYPRIRAACMDFACARLMQHAGYEQRGLRPVPDGTGRRATRVGGAR